MKRLIASVMFVFLYGSPAVSTAQVKRNPLQVAMNKWYDINQITSFQLPPGEDVFGMAFDGVNLWVTGSNYNQIYKVRVSDGTRLGTFSIASVPTAVAFDGQVIWVANYGSHNVTKIRLDDGANVGQFSTGGYGPRALAFDGQNMWVANTNSANVSKLSTSGVLLGTFPVGDVPTALLFDGKSIWVANEGSDNVMKLRPSDGVILQTYGVGHFPRSLAFDGTKVWVGSIGRITLIGGKSIPLRTGSTPDTPDLLVFDGTFMWLGMASGNLVKMNLTGGKLGTFPIGAGLDAMAFDGAFIWTAQFSSLNKR